MKHIFHISLLNLHLFPNDIIGIVCIYKINSEFNKALQNSGLCGIVGPRKYIAIHFEDPNLSKIIYFHM